MKKLIIGIVIGIMLAIPTTAGAHSLYFTSDEIEEIHDNTEAAYLTIVEDDGDVWYYKATADDKWKAMN